MNKRKITLFTILLTAEILLLASGFGIISNGSLSITVLQIPVILAAVLLGLPWGCVLGAVFGIGTMIIAGGYGVETLDHLFVNPCISVLPRILIAVASWLTYRKLKKVIDDHTMSAEFIACGGAACVGTLTNTILVTLALCVAAPRMMGGGNGISVYASAFANILGANTSLEICLSIVLVSGVTLVLKRKELQEFREVQPPMRKTFQKWLIVVMTGGFVVTLLCSYTMQTIQARRKAEKTLEASVSKILQGTEAVPGYSSPSLNVGLNGIALAAKDGTIVTAGSPKLIGKTLSEAGFSTDIPENEVFSSVLSGSTYYCKAKTSGEITVIAMIPGDEIYAERNGTAIILLLVNLVIFAIIFLLISKLLQENVVERIYSINHALSLIQEGNMDEVVEVRNNEEFSVLSDGINATVNALKDTMEEVAAKMNQEMEFARQIQQSALPLAEHVVPKLHEYEILGTMDAAKEVGGDFYDYFLVGEQKLGFVIADVSGKGVPAALFMMTAKTLLKNFVLNGKSAAEALELANMQLCENNEAGMFVTVWLGILDYEKGELEFANAGHNPPLLKKAGEPFIYMDHKTYKRSIMLGMRENVHYKNNRIPFGRGDILYLYTDGVTEANNVKEELYGEERLRSCLEANYEQPPEELIRTIRADIDDFAGEAEQFDDITMVVLKMHGEWKTMAVDAVYENTAQLAAFVEENLPAECGKKICHQIAIAFDELYSNVVKYSKASRFELRLGIMADRIYLIFIDDGIPYNPLESAEPDTDAPRENRPIGGLGLFMVKRSMDEIDYQYRDKKNIFSIGKKYI